MKRKLVGALVFAALLLLLPALALAGGAAGPLNTTPVDPEGQDPAAADPAGGYVGEPMLVYDEGTGSVLELSERDYVIGAVMSEVPALYGDEALKAQAVACHTYALCVRQLRQQIPDESLNGGYFSINTTTMSGFMTEAKGLSYYGASYEQYYNKVAAAVDAVFGQILLYEGEPISACYHAISPGKTERSENVFAAALPYLVAADSNWDLAAEGYQSSASFSAAEFESLLALYDNKFAASGEPESWLGESKKSESGTVLSLYICGRNFHGTGVRAALSLRSAAFDVAYNAETGNFDFTVYGYGHGVGLSQYGANAMAAEGYGYAEILAHYYPGTQLARLKEE